MQRGHWKMTLEKENGEHDQPRDPEALSEAEARELEGRRKGKKRALAPQKRALAPPTHGVLGSIMGNA